MESVIKLKNIRKTYNGNQLTNEVLKGIDIDIKNGDFVSIMGPSGSGKSTLLYIMGGLLKPSNGDVLIDNNNIVNLSDRLESKLRSDKIGFVFQFYNLVAHLNVEENILLPVLINGKNKKEYKERLNIILDKVGLSNKRKSYPRELSGGEQQRVAIARALINSPRIILADEPIGNLDSKTGKEIMTLLQDINKTLNTTIVQVTHSLDSTKYGNKVINVRDGILV